jgi:uncharacterized protein (TIGR02145 family)
LSIFSSSIAFSQLDAKKHADILNVDDVLIEMYIEKPKTICSNREWRFKLKFVRLPRDVSKRFLTWKFRTVNCDDYIVENVISVDIKGISAGPELLGNTDWVFSAKSVETGIYDASLQSTHSLAKTRVIDRISSIQRSSVYPETGISRVTVDTTKNDNSIPQFKRIISGSLEIQIGDRTWMAENLNVTTFKNGDPIPEAKTSEEWEVAGRNGQPAWCYYLNDPRNEQKYGKLYNWYAVNDARGLAPNGWNVADDEDWYAIAKQSGGMSKAGLNLKSAIGWDLNGSGLNIMGFNGHPGGYRTSDGTFRGIGSIGNWWCSKEANSTLAWYRNLYSVYNDLGRTSGNKSLGLSVRCIKEYDTAQIVKIDKRPEPEYKEIRIGNQIWMERNLNVIEFRNGDIIPQAISNEDWIRAGENMQPAWCYYENDRSNESKYGKLYNWFALIDLRGLAPDGWHVANDDEWTELTAYLMKAGLNGLDLKSKSGWNTSGVGTNKTGFSALPGGFRDNSGSFSGLGTIGYWWASVDSRSPSWYRSLYYSNTNANRSIAAKQSGFSVRCIKNYGEYVNRRIKTANDKLNRSKEVTIGNQTWMAANLDVEMFRNGDPIFHARTADEWLKAVADRQPAWCYYNNDQSNGHVYGKLYNWYAVNDPRGLSPKGWHVPTDMEWKALTDYLGGEGIAGGKLVKDITDRSTVKDSVNIAFSAIPGGSRNYDGVYYDLGKYSYFWTKTEYANGKAILRGIRNGEEDVIRFNYPKGSGFSVRCVKD